MPMLKSALPLLAACMTSTLAVGAQAPLVPSAPSLHDFDFLIGDWRVHNRQLAHRLAGSHEWVEFEAVDSFHALPGQLGIEENYATGHWADFRAIGLHLYDPEKKRWTLYWADTRNSPGTIQTLASGGFESDVGTFYAPDSYDGKPITVRVIWKRTDSSHVYWEQAFSADNAKSWETNWTMEFLRVQ
jgi:hypothetical protein